jgi:hypothetical protein
VQARDFGENLLYRGLRVFPGKSVYARVSAQMGVMSRMPGSCLLRKPHCTFPQVGVEGVVVGQVVTLKQWVRGFPGTGFIEAVVRAA